MEIIQEPLYKSKHGKNYATHKALSFYMKENLLSYLWQKGDPLV